MLLDHGIFALILPQDNGLTLKEQFQAESILESTLKSVFPHVLRLEGKHSILLASERTDLTADSEKLDERAKSVGLYPTALLPDNLLSAVLPIFAARKNDLSKDFPQQEMPINTVQNQALSHMIASIRESNSSLQQQWPVRIFSKIPTAAGAGLTLLFLIYLLMRYFISGKAIHKNLFRAFENGFFSGGILLFVLTQLRYYDSARETGSPEFLTAVFCLSLCFFAMRRLSERRFLSPCIAAVLFFLIYRNGLNLVYPVLLLIFSALGVCSMQNCFERIIHSGRDLFLIVRYTVLGLAISLLIFPVFLAFQNGIWVWVGILMLIRISHARAVSFFPQTASLNPMLKIQKL